MSAVIFTSIETGAPSIPFTALAWKPDAEELSTIGRLRMKAQHCFDEDVHQVCFRTDGVFDGAISDHFHHPDFKPYMADHHKGYVVINEGSRALLGISNILDSCDQDLGMDECFYVVEREGLRLAGAISFVDGFESVAFVTTEPIPWNDLEGLND